MKTNINHGEYFTPIQMKFPVDLEKIIESSDPIYSFNEIMDEVDLNHVYIDGTKLEANANKYSWVCKKSCITNRNKVFLNLTLLIKEINNTDLKYLNVEIGTRQEYSVEYVEYILNEYEKLLHIDISTFVYGSGKHKTTVQKHYEKLSEYLDRLKQYSHHIKTCGENRNSYSKTDYDATFMRNKRDYMGNDQLLPAYNVQVGICDEYIAVMDVQQFTSDMDCFIPLMEKFHRTYGFYPEYPVADAGYGSYNNYLFCHRNGMGKYMKFTMFNKETTDKKYHEDIFRAVNFKRDENGNLICPNYKKFNYLHSSPVKGNKFGRTEEYYQCEYCTGCPCREKCHKSENNRIIRLNEELTSFHQEVVDNLECVHGALLRMNRSIQAEGTYGVIKWNREYTRVRRRGLKSVNFEFSAICLGFNLHKYHLKKQKALLAA